MKTASLLSIAALGLATLASAAHADQYHGVAIPQTGPGLTRAEVQADFALWQRAGLVDRTDDSSVYFSADHQARLAQYHRWRQGAEFRAEVQRQSGSPVALQAAPLATTAQN